MIENYEKYLEFISGKIDGFFEKQKPYIACKEGCSLCCKKGEYPWSEIEYKYLMKGLLELPTELQNQIKAKIEQIKKDKENFKEDGIFFHECPFLINKKCSVYKYRGIVCRTFGLLVQVEGKKPQIPFCCSMGLNYSNVYDIEKRSISQEMFDKTGLDVQPIIFNVSYKFLTNDAFAEGYGFNFGDKKPMIDWF